MLDHAGQAEEGATLGHALGVGVDVQDGGAAAFEIVSMRGPCNNYHRASSDNIPVIAG